jgi:hypothetical protein
MVALRLAALHGVGVAQMPTTVVGRDLREGTLIDVLPDWAPKTGIIHAVFPSRRELLPSVRALLDFLTAEYATLSRAEALAAGGDEAKRAFDGYEEDRRRRDRGGSARLTVLSGAEATADGAIPIPSDTMALTRTTALGIAPVGPL